ncbi:MAG: hypothetical protein CHACPFDD_03711 [Phycisphaerae bacterium]|nr:hypothetical protein [Phycisphaerae bacterium]
MSTMRSLTGLAAGLLALSTGARATAQAQLDAPVGQYVSWELDSGALDNASGEPLLLFSTQVQVEEAAWMRLYFAEVTLRGASFVRVTSLLDGATQELDAAAIGAWGNTTAYFNGAAVTLELIAGPRTAGNRVALDRVAVEFSLAGSIAEACGICGGDDRVSSNEDWSGRLMPVGCTASVYTVDSCIVTAGHCSGGSNLVIQFRVPPSNANCTLNQPTIEEQFPITAQQFQSAGVGNDWGVMTTGANNLGQTAFERYGVYRRVAYTPGGVGETGTLWGYGVDGECVKSQTQQTSSGPIVSRGASAYSFSIDLQGGNSGTGLIFDSEIIAIVTHCQVGCPNFGTRSDRPNFVAARAAVCPTQCNPCDVNCDGTVNGFDVEPFVDLLNFVGTKCDACAGDVNGDGFVNGFDIDGLVACLTGG